MELIRAQRKLDKLQQRVCTLKHELRAAEMRLMAEEDDLIEYIEKLKLKLHKEIVENYQLKDVPQ